MVRRGRVGDHPPAMLVATNVAARGQVLRRLRYLPAPARLIRLPETRLRGLPELLRPGEDVILVWSRDVGYGSAALRLSAQERSRTERRMKAAGHKKLSARANKKSSGWMLWEGRLNEDQPAELP